jgi:anti-sigma regulatory factor (Ser/Thr protein kinase)
MEIMGLIGRAIPIKSSDSSQTGNARRQAISLADSLAFDELPLGQLGIVVTEAARNIENHGGEGEIVLSPWRHGESAGIDVLALDKGRGIENIAVSMTDGYSTAGTPGNGLGAMARLAGIFQVFSTGSNGTALFARIFAKANQQESVTDPNDLGSICLPVHGETQCGDAWEVHRSPDRTLYIVADGLGHGPIASEASQEAIRVFRAHVQHTPERILSEVHSALAKTRGAAVSVAEIVHEKHVLNYAGAGNIAAAICTHGKTRSLVSMNGTVGHSIGRIQQFTYPWENGCSLIMHSDGVGTKWNLGSYPGLSSRHPALLAGVLFRDFARKRDDATIIVSRI